MNVQGIIDTAIAANVTNIAVNEATSQFRSAHSNSIVVKENLSKKQKQILEKLTDIPLIFESGKSPMTDHLIIAACRNIIRIGYEKKFHIKHTLIKSLVIGASAREIRSYWENPYICYHIHGQEAKDATRFVLPSLEVITEKINNKLKKNQLPDQYGISPYNHYWDIKSLCSDLSFINNRVISTDLQCAEQLILEDSMYNFGPQDYIDLFEKTQAKVAYGYGLLPYELLFDDMPQNELYSFCKVRKDYIDENGVWKWDDYGMLNWRHGNSNGYMHKLSTWETLIKNPVIKGEHFSLIIEIDKFVGPMCFFSIVRTNEAEHHTRQIELPDNLKYVKILDVEATYNSNIGTFSDRKYCSIKENDFLNIIDYLYSLDESTLKLQNVCAHIRRRMGGVPLHQGELLKPWDIPPQKVRTVAITCLLYVIIQNKRDKEIMSNLLDHDTGFMNAVKKCCLWPVDLLIKFIRFIVGKRLDQSLVVYPQDCGVSLQYGYSFSFKPTVIPYNSYACVEIPEKPYCDFCSTYIQKPQVCKCQKNDESFVEITFTDKELAMLHTSLTNVAEKPTVLAQLMQKADTNLPSKGFTIKVKMHLVLGGPGTGKSEVIRNMVTQFDLVVGPFRRLKEDYSCNGKDGEKIVYKTEHTALSERNRKRIFVDEFSSYPYELLVVLLYVTGCEEVYLFGDTKQSKVVQGNGEGVYIGDKIDLSRLDTHHLLCNFRLPLDAIAKLNEVFNYEMFPNPLKEYKKYCSIVGVSVNDEVMRRKIAEDRDIVPMSFSEAQAFEDSGSTDRTVRKNQGLSTKRTVVYLDATKNKNVMNLTSMQIVAVSRHTEMCYLVSDGSSHADNLIKKLATTPEWLEHLETFIKYPDIHVESKVMGVGETEIFEPIDKPTSDAYLDAEVFVPLFAVDPEITAMNELSANVITSKAIKAKTNEADLFAVSKGGFPSSIKQHYRSIGCSYGLHYQAKRPYQELACIAKRYDGPRRHYKFDSNSYQMVTDMVDEYFLEHKDISMLHGKDNGTCVDDMVLDDLMLRFFEDARKKNYLSRSEKQLIDNYGIEVIQFSIKSGFKPSNSDKKMNLFKVAQGVSAWSSYLASLFCLAFRYIQYVDQMTNRRDHQSQVITDNGLSEKEFFTQLKEAIDATYPESTAGLMNGTTDAVEFDSLQNEFTQNIEYQYLLKLGLNKEFLDNYYQYRKNMPVHGKYFTTRLDHEKTSGEPGTLFNNGVVSKVCSNYMVRGKGPVVTVYKGDDHNKLQLALHIDEDRRKWVSQQCGIEFKLWVRKTGEFCGCLVTDKGIVPNMMRRVHKIIGQRFRDYTHFSEYQHSLREYISLINYVGVNSCIGAVMQTYNTNYITGQNCYDYIRSMSHINEIQFLNITVEHDVVPYATTFVNDDVAVIEDVNPVITNDLKDVEDVIEEISTKLDLDRAIKAGQDVDIVVTDHDCPRIHGLKCSICDDLGNKLESNSVLFSLDQNHEGNINISHNDLIHDFKYASESKKIVVDNKFTNILNNTLSSVKNKLIGKKDTVNVRRTKSILSMESGEDTVFNILNDDEL